MSCIQLSTQHTAAVAHGLAFILNGAGGMDQLSCFAITSQVCRAFKSCMYPHDSLFDDRKIYAVLYKLNETAYLSRLKRNTTATPTVRTPKQCVFNSSSTASRTTKPGHFSSATGSGGRRRWVSGSVSSTTTASMPPTASWRFWTASSKTDTLTGLHRKAAPSQPAMATRHRPRYLYTKTGKSKNSNPYRDER